MSSKQIHILVLALLLLFWFNGLWHLDRFPTIQFDEPTILAPGYKLFQQGVYGSDLYVGFHNQDQIYLEVTPFMSLLQGFSTWLWGIGVWQLRYTAVAAGTLTLGLIYTLGCWFFNKRVGVMAMALAFFWQWSPGGDALFGTGIALVDIARIARYDIFVPVFGLASILCGWLSFQTSRKRYSFLSGILVGLAGLANIYGLFWGVALIGIYLIEAIFKIASQRILPQRHKGINIVKGLLFPLILGIMVIWLPWLIISIWHWDAMLGQFGKHTGRLDFTQASFYIQNFKAEIHRYRFFLYETQTYLRLGFWLFVLGLPAASLYISINALIHRDSRVIWLIVPIITFLILFTLLEEKKRYYYVATLVPLFSIVIAEGLVFFFHRVKRPLRVITIALLFLAWVQGGSQLIRMHAKAQQARPPAQFFVELQQFVPTSSRVMGPVQYWLANPAWDYRAEPLMYHLSSPEDKAAVSFEEALNQIAPDIILVTPKLYEGLDVSTRYYQDQTDYRETFDAFMRRHNATVIGELIDYDGRSVTLYQLIWP